MKSNISSPLRFNSPATSINNLDTQSDSNPHRRVSSPPTTAALQTPRRSPRRILPGETFTAPSSRTTSPHPGSFSQVHPATAEEASTHSADEEIDLESGGGDQATQDAPTDPSPPSTPTLRSRASKFADRAIARTVNTASVMYGSYIMINALIHGIKYSADFHKNFSGSMKNLFTSAERADFMKVQRGRELVLAQYGSYIDTKLQCVDPVISFHNQPPRDWLGRFVPKIKFISADSSEKPHPIASGEIRFKTYNEFLQKTAVHEYLHCYTHPNFYSFVDAIVPKELRKNFIEGTTEYLTQKTNFGGLANRTKYAAHAYLKETDSIAKIADQVGTETVKQAYFSGNITAMLVMAEAAVQNDKREGKGNGV